MIESSMKRAARVAPSRGDSPPRCPAQIPFHTLTAQIIWIALAALVFAPTILWLWHRWTMDVWHNVHGLLIPFALAYFGYRAMRSDQVPDVEQSAWGFAFLIPGLAMVVLDSAIGTQLLSAVGLLLCLPGISLLLLGSRRTRKLTFVWILSLFMLPIPAAFVETFLLLLRRITAAGTEFVIGLSGIPVGREDTILFMPRQSISITEGCSGFSVLYAAIALALVLAAMNSSWRARAVPLALAVPVAIACNIVRCSMLGLLVERWGGGILDTVIHPLSGMLTFTVAAALLTYVGTVKIRRHVT
jgi:exosortase